MKIGYLGPAGSYSHWAAIAYCPQGEPIPLDSFLKIIEAVQEGSLDLGLLPVENSTEGAVTSVMDALIHISGLRLQGEITLPIEHSIMGTAEDWQEVKFVVSHPQALEQCRSFLQQRWAELELIPCQSTSEACRIAKEKGRRYAAIANRLAATRHQLNILYTGIQDNSFNQTRFIVLGKGQPRPTGKDKTSIVFSFPDDHPGNLFSVLKAFAEKEINLTRIESRPAKSELGKYIFFIDFLGHQEDPVVAAVLHEIARLTIKLKVLGSYPQGSLVQLPETQEETLSN